VRCSSRNYILFAIFVPKIIKVGGISKFDKVLIKMCLQFFLGQSMHVLHFA